MHETGIVRDLVSRIVRAAHEAGASKVRGVHVWIGALTSLSPEHLREHFEEEARGTPVEGTALHIELSDDTHHAQSQHVMLQRLDLEVPESKDGGR
ncbi:hydrogenase maturation nickel metallochaperone HypA (plasmid) [Burkholderia thailandensis]|uniref:hydrogenase maturation nickel metallochaperone HypA/HybF n=1 Tax=Burkholderia thailandensis TaxID=57975 RepID=UPI00192D8DF7|nr:hydrogenase maturation nickel metallochaperone HypA [Burkholderia thailandensis]MBS2132199.1 hydrogenase maturation nickel metallochaperone HypA [Burkholderia thailandensis]QRA15295.1 hydrogenase maturation nickel metallochaperone HypA [Burkholderia thailandensis]